MWRVAFVGTCLVAIDVAVAPSVCMVSHALVATYVSRRNVRNDSASTVSGPIAYISDTIELVSIVDCVFE